MGAYVYGGRKKVTGEQGASTSGDGEDLLVVGILAAIAPRFRRLRHRVGLRHAGALLRGGVGKQAR